MHLFPWHCPSGRVTLPGRKYASIYYYGVVDTDCDHLNYGARSLWHRNCDLIYYLSKQLTFSPQTLYLLWCKWPLLMSKTAFWVPVPRIFACFQGTSPPLTPKLLMEMSSSRERAAVHTFLSNGECSDGVHKLAQWNSGLFALKLRCTWLTKAHQMFVLLVRH